MALALEPADPDCWVDVGRCESCRRRDVGLFIVTMSDGMRFEVCRDCAELAR